MSRKPKANSTDEIEVSSEMIDAGFAELAISGDFFSTVSALSASDLRAVYIAMRRLESADLSPNRRGRREGRGI